MSPRAAARLESLGFTHVYDYVAGKTDWIADGLPLAGADASQTRAGDLVRTEVPTCTLNEETNQVLDLMDGVGLEICAVVDAERVVLGLLTRASVEADPEATVEQLMEPGPSTDRPRAFPGPLLRYMERRDVASVLVTTSDGRLVGAAERETARQATD